MVGAKMVAQDIARCCLKEYLKERSKLAPNGLMHVNGERAVSTIEMKPVYYEPTPVEKKELQAYCERDVLLSVQLASTLPLPFDAVRRPWEINARINARGVGIDLPFATAAVECAQQAKDTSNAKLPGLTNDQIHSVTQTVALRAWINAETDLALPNVSEATLRDVDLDSVPEHVAQVIEARLNGRAAAVGKYKAAVLGTSKRTRRFHGAFLSHGAPTTGRFTSGRIQLHNMFANKGMEPDVVERRNRRVVQETRPGLRQNWRALQLDDLAQSVRAMIIRAKGHVLVKADWAQIEARVAPWLARHLHPSATALLYVFETGHDVYKYQASAMFDLKYNVVNKQQRFMGKVAQLSLGYQGGYRALNRMARANGAPEFEEREARRLVALWREKNPWAVKAWAALEKAVLAAVQRPGSVQDACSCRYQVTDDHRFLRCTLPSGRHLFYPFPRIEEGRFGDPQVTYKKATRQPKATDPEWPRTALYGGILLENVTQAASACVLIEALDQCHRFGLPAVSDVHDEIVLEVPEQDAEIARNALLSIMRIAASRWAPDLPLDAEADILERYR